MSEKYKKGTAEPMVLGEPQAHLIDGSNAMTFDEDYPAQGDYTADDYLQMTEGRQAELIDGVIYDMATAVPAHQVIAHELGFELETFIRKHNGNCQVFSASQDVQLDPDDRRNVLEPDLQVVCDKDKYKGKMVVGAPDLVVEILSPSTRERDMTTKLWLYKNAGVREYWIIDPERLRVIVYEFLPEFDDATYSFHDRIPVGIYDGQLVIDFEKIYDKIKELQGVG